MSPAAPGGGPPQNYQFALRRRGWRPRASLPLLVYKYSMLSRLAAPSRRADNTSALYILRMSRNAFFPLGGHFVEHSLTLCEPCRSWRTANDSREMPGGVAKLKAEPGTPRDSQEGRQRHSGRRERFGRRSAVREMGADSAFSAIDIHFQTWKRVTSWERDSLLSGTAFVLRRADQGLSAGKSRQ